MKLEKELEVKNQKGLHTRPAATIAKMLAHTSSFVSFTCRQQTVDAKQMMNLLLLEATYLSKITVSIHGDDAQPLLAQLSHYFDTYFGEER